MQYKHDMINDSSATEWSVLVLVPDMLINVLYQDELTYTYTLVSYYGTYPLGAQTRNLPLPRRMS